MLNLLPYVNNSPLNLINGSINGSIINNLQINSEFMEPVKVTLDD